jgi:hypothetical protein
MAVVAGNRPMLAETVPMPRPMLAETLPMSRPMLATATTGDQNTWLPSLGGGGGCMMLMSRLCVQTQTSVAVSLPGAPYALIYTTFDSHARNDGQRV